MLLPASGMASRTKIAAVSFARIERSGSSGAMFLQLLVVIFDFLYNFVA